MKTIEDIFIQSKQDMIDAVNALGILPLFPNTIKGFSILERCAKEVDMSAQVGIWDWKGPVIQETHSAYGKFFENKAVFISPKYYCDFANFRRDGYDYDARVDEGMASYDEQYLYGLIASHYSILSKQLKVEGGYNKPRKNDSIQWEARKGFDTQIAKLQRLGYVTITNFEYEMDKQGNFYGWGVARYATFENAFQKKFVNHVYDRTPEESYTRLVRHLKRILPHVAENEIDYFLKK